MRAELESYLDVLEPMLAAIRAVRQDALLQSCSEQRLMAFERMLAIPINGNIPLEERRQIAVSKMSIGPSDFHREGLEKALNAIGVNATVQETPGRRDDHRDRQKSGGQPDDAGAGKGSL